MSIKIKYIGHEKYSTGTTNIREPWNSTPRRDAYKYEIYDEDHPDIISSFTVVDDYGDNIHLDHMRLFKKAIDTMLDLQKRIDAYDSLSNEDKFIFEKFKQIYK